MTPPVHSGACIVHLWKKRLYKHEEYKVYRRKMYIITWKKLKVQNAVSTMRSHFAALWEISRRNLNGDLSINVSAVRITSLLTAAEH